MAWCTLEQAVYCPSPLQTWNFTIPSACLYSDNNVDPFHLMLIVVCFLPRFISQKRAHTCMGSTNTIFEDYLMNGSAVSCSRWSTVFDSIVVFVLLSKARNWLFSPFGLSFVCQGYHGDTSKTFLCGDVSDAMKRLVKVYVCLISCKL